MTRDLTIVNALGILDNPNSAASIAAASELNPTSDQLTIDERTLADARASGLTAVNVTLGYTMGEMEPYAHTLREIATWDRLVAEHPADLVQVLTAADIDRARADGRIGIIYGFQNAVAVGDDPGRVAEFQRLGVRVIQLTYNQANHLGDGSMAAENRGLSAIGRDVVAALNDARVMVDLSHSGERTCLDAIRTSAAPISINHTGCRALVDVPRNKTDEELRLVADSGGFVGIYFMPFLSPTGHATAADVVAHLEHAVDVCGEDAVGIGTDGGVTGIDDLETWKKAFAAQINRRRAMGISAPGERSDSYIFAIDMTGPEQFRILAEKLSARGHPAARIDKILGLNFLRYAERIWGG